MDITVGIKTVSHEISSAVFTLVPNCSKPRTEAVFERTFVPENENVTEHWILGTRRGRLR